MTQLRETLTIANRLGIHARAAALLAKLAEGYRCQIVLSKDGRQARATSVLELLMLCGQQGSEVEVRVDGDDGQEALSAVRELFAERFGEPD